MNISPILLLTIGCLFGLGYASFITLGWALTRRNRKNLQKAKAINYVGLFDITKMTIENETIKTVSLFNNKFLTLAGDSVDVSDYKFYIAKGESQNYPAIKPGDLILINKSGEIKYAFEIPDLKNFR